MERRFKAQASEHRVFGGEFELLDLVDSELQSGGVGLDKLVQLPDHDRKAKWN